MKNVIDAMEWRYATNKFDPIKKLSAKDLNNLMEAVILSPSSFGLQPWKLIVVTNPKIRAKLQEAGYGQPKISEASHLIVFAAEKNIDDTLIDNFIKTVAKTRSIPIENLKGKADMMKGSILSKTIEQRVEWVTRQVYIALGVLITTAAIAGIDVGPMEGFDPKKFDEILGLDKMGLEAKVIAAVGYRASDDPNLQLKKVRFSKEDILIEIK